MRHILATLFVFASLGLIAAPKVQLKLHQLYTDNAIFQRGVAEYPIKGYVCVKYKGIPLGYGKGDGNMIKNKYPKGLRTNDAF